MTDFQTDKRTLLFLLDQIEQRELALPDFQRDFVWEAGATRELVSSIFRSFPAGSLLLLHGGADLLEPRSFEEAPALEGSKPSYLVLDGQQRLTSLYLAMTGQGTHRYFLNVGWLIDGPGDSDVDEAVEVYPMSRAKRWASVDAQATDLMLPLSRLRCWADWRDDVLEHRHAAGEDVTALRKRLNEVNNQQIKRVEQYQFPVTVLDESTSPEAVCTIFETLNRTGIKLSVFELLTARAFAHGVGLRAKWAQSREDHPILTDFDVDPYYVLQVIALLEGASAKRSGVLKLSVLTLEKHWEQAVGGIAGTLSLLREECGVLVGRWLPYETMLITLGAAWTSVTNTSGPAAGARRAKVKRYFWCAVFSGRYENAPNTVAEQDLPALRAWMEGGAAPTVVDQFAFDPDRWRDVTVRQRGLYRATIALLSSVGALDFHTSQKLDHYIVAGNAVDDHHIFPRNYLAKAGFQHVPDSVLNHTLIDKATNISISDHAPSEYLAQMRGELGAEKLAQILASHGLPTDENGALWQNDFERFLERRVQYLERLLKAVAVV